jgi:glucosamine 6-phosphate synthetase-like amidotransferase/phosphosugar isomerase protein
MCSWTAFQVFDAQHQLVQREVLTVNAHSGAAELGPYSHYMQKEIFEQPRAIADTLEGIEGIVADFVRQPCVEPSRSCCQSICRH